MVSSQVWLWGGDPVHLRDEPVGAGMSREHVQVPTAWGGSTAPGCGRCEALHGFHRPGRFLHHLSAHHLPCPPLQGHVWAIDLALAHPPTPQCHSTPSVLLGYVCSLLITALLNRRNKLYSVLWRPSGRPINHQMLVTSDSVGHGSTCPLWQAV